MLTAQYVLAGKPSVVFIAPDPINSKNVFWSDFIKLMRKAADDLEVDLEVLHADSNRFSAWNKIELALNVSNPPDYLICIGYKNAIFKILSLAESKQVKTLIVNSRVSDKDIQSIGKPGEIFEHWLGSITPADEQAGYLLGKQLIESALKKSPQNRLGMLAFTGTRDNTVSENRVKGLLRAVREHLDRITLHQITNADWNLLRVKEKWPTLLRRYPDTRIVWSAGAGMSLGVLAASTSNTVNLNAMSIGELEWSPEVLQLVNSGDIDVAVGGHFMEGAWSMVLIKDHYHRPDFRSDLGIDYQTGFHAVSSKGLQNNHSYYLNRGWEKADFKQYSKYYNPELQHYNFSIGLD